MHYIIKNVYKVKWLILAQVVLWLVATVAISLIPACNKYLVDYVFLNSGKNFPALLLVYGTCSFVYLAAIWGSERFVWKTAIAFENALKKQCFDAVLQMKFGVFSKKKSEEYLSMLTNDISRVEQDYLQPICALVKSSVSVVVYAVVVSIYTSPLICTVLFALSILASFTPKIYKKRLRTAGKAFVNEAAVYTKKTSDLLKGFELADRVSRPFFSRENARNTDALSKKRHVMGKAKVNGNTISGTAVFLIDIAVFALCGIMMLNGHITAGTIFAAVTYAQSFTEPVQEILYDINMLNSTKDIIPSLEDLLSLLDGNQEHSLEPAHASLTLNNTRVVFPDKVLCYNASFRLGKKYLITGESGSGKTTLLKALLGRIPSTDDISPEEWTGVVSEDECFYLSQHQHVFSDDTFNNVTIFGAYPYPDATTDAQILLKSKMQKSEDCTKLSGGEQQFLKLYRMLAQKKDILLLDEPFSSMDGGNAREAFHMISQIPATIILVSHNVTFDKADLAQWKIVRIEEVCHEK